MIVTLAVLADYASVSADGKISVMGIWNEINPSRLPAQVLTPYLVLSFEGDVIEAGQPRKVRLVLHDADAHELMRAEQDMVLPTPARAGARPRANAILRIPVLQFPKAGDYRFAVEVENRIEGEVRLTVNDPPAGPPQGSQS